MKNTDISQLFSVPFGAQADSTTIATIPTTKTAIGRASMALGFPKENFQPLDNGGQPVSGADLNGILNTLARSAQAAELGMLHSFSASYAAAIGGYPSGATIAHPTISGRFLICTQDGNTNDPSQNMTGWSDPLAGNATTTSLTSETQRAEQAEAALQSNIATLEQALANSIAGVPIGVPIKWPSNTIPSNAQLMVGQTFTAASNPQLAFMYPGLVIPDMRGMFARGLDTTGTVDRDGATRALLSFQEGTRKLFDSIGNYSHPNSFDSNDGLTTMSSLGVDPIANKLEKQSVNWSTSGGWAVLSAANNGAISSYSKTAWDNITVMRPKNIAFNYIVRVI